MDVSTIVSLVGVLGLGSAVGQYLASGGQRRETRGDVLKALSRTERLRWAGNVDERLSMRDAMRDLQTAALLARLPREAVRQYQTFAMAGWWLSTESLEEAGGDIEFGGGVHGDFATLVHDSAVEVSRLVWSPWLGRIRFRKRLSQRSEKALAIHDSSVRAKLAAAQRYVA